MMQILIILGKCVSRMSQLIGKGSGSTWPGYIVLSMYPRFIARLHRMNPQTQIVFVSGTNGKTTTSMLLSSMLTSHGKKIFYNQSGANLMNGMASGFLNASRIDGKISYDFLIFEVDENVLPLMLKEVMPAYIICLNLFRDQLDRYGELMTIAKKWQTSFAKLNDVQIVLNGDDPLVAWLGLGIEKPIYFGLPVSQMQKSEIIHGADSTYCPRCESKLEYKKVSYSHVGDWHCPSCGLNRPTPTYAFKPFTSELSGLYNQYNMAAAATVAKRIGATDSEISDALMKVHPAFGRQEKVQKDGKEIQIILSKNPTGTNQSIETVLSLSKHPRVLFVLNDRIPDGTDVSWIWDTNMEQYINSFAEVLVSGDRVYDMALRIQYAGCEARVFPSLEEAIETGVKNTPKGETFYILPTYSAMLDVRKIITGRSIL